MSRTEELPAKKTALPLRPPCSNIRAMFALVSSAALNRIEAFPVEAEVNCALGDAGIVMVGSISPDQTTGGRPPRRRRRIRAFQLPPRLARLSLLCALCFFPSFSPAASTNEMISRAMSALEAAAPRAQSDPARPIFHITAPAQWMNDPNGPIYHNGLYHVFYQLHPFSDGDGPKYWGHVRSRDLVKWEALPIALWPSTEMGEAGVWSGCCALNGQGEPMIFYTSVAAGQSAQTHAEQWAAIGDKDLITWRKSPANPLLSESLHGSTKIYDWRDPFIFRDQMRTFLVAGGNLNKAQGGQAVVNIYESENSGLTQWKYRGVLFQIPDAEARTAECPNFFKVGDHWVLLVSPYGKVQYYVGDFDAATCRFQARARGLLDCGPNFYAPNTMQLPDGRRIVWGWVNGFPDGRGWKGCLSLPRVLSLSSDGQLRQNPAPQLRKLRGAAVVWRNTVLHGEGAVFRLPHTNTLEIQAEILLRTSDSVILSLKNAAANPAPVLMKFSGSEFKMGDASGPLSLAGSERKLDLRIFIDRSVLEIFANDTLCATKIISPLDAGATLQLSSPDGSAQAKLIEAWPMKTIW
jgi:beta-fructofuranosidase